MEPVPPALESKVLACRPLGMSLISVVFCVFFLLYNISLVLPYINMHPPWVYTCSPSWTPLPPPSPYHPSGSSQCTSPKLPVSCTECVLDCDKSFRKLIAFPLGGWVVSEKMSKGRMGWCFYHVSPKVYISYFILSQSCPPCCQQDQCVKLAFTQCWDFKGWHSHPLT